MLWELLMSDTQDLIEPSAEFDGDPSELGQLVWHSSGEDEGPDVGMSLGLGDGRSLYLGEMPTSTLTEHGIDVKETGDGWWLVMYDDKGRLETRIGALVVGDGQDARDIFDQLFALAQQALLSGGALERRDDAEGTAT